MLPKCMFNNNFRVFGIRVYLRTKESLICPIRAVGQTKTPVRTLFPTSHSALITTTQKLSPNNVIRLHHHENPDRARPQAVVGGPVNQVTLRPFTYDETIIFDDAILQRQTSSSSITASRLNKVSTSINQQIIVCAILPFALCKCHMLIISFITLRNHL